MYSVCNLNCLSLPSSTVLFCLYLFLDKPCTTLVLLLYCVKVDVLVVHFSFELYVVFLNMWDIRKISMHSLYSVHNCSIYMYMYYFVDCQSVNSWVVGVWHGALVLYGKLSLYRISPSVGVHKPL